MVTIRATAMGNVMQIHKQNIYHEDLEFLHNDIDNIHQWWHDVTVQGREKKNNF